MSAKKSKAHYIAAATHEVVFVTDLDQGVSVTNDAEAVVADLLAQYPGRRIIYCDTNGHWDELVHDGKAFVNFAPLSHQDYIRYLPYIA